MNVESLATKAALDRPTAVTFESRGASERATSIASGNRPSRRGDT